MKKKQGSLKAKLWGIAIIPVLCMGMSALIISSYIVYTSMAAEIKNELNNLVHVLYYSVSTDRNFDKIMNGNGDSSNEDIGILDEIQKISGVDATIFRGDERILTSVRSKDGLRAVGTHASKEVIQDVLVEGKEYFSSAVSVNDRPYFGYYIPIKNSQNKIIGMVFAGKERHSVMKAVANTILLIFLVIGIITVITSVISLNYANKIVYSLNKTKEFLKEVAHGNIRKEMDDYPLKRNDEIGEMGRFSIMLQKWIIELVSTDSLTGLKNRWSYNKVFPQLIQECKKGKMLFVLAIGDIDGFKGINDKYGHMAGDKVLQELATVFAVHMKQKGHVFRWGGEEFLFLFERTCKEVGVGCLEELLEEIRSKVITYRGQVISVTMTFGVVDCSEAEDYNLLIAKADENLYRGKTSGKNQIVLSQN